MNEAELIKAVLAGRTERFEALVTQYMGLARGLCASHVRDSAAHDDLVQESFLYAYTKLGTLRNTNRFGPWLGSIVRSKCRDWLRRNRRAEEAARALAAEASAATVSTPEDALMGKELRDWVRAHIAHLPERTREAMFLCYAEGLEQKEAAAFLDIKLSALKKRLQYGRDQLSERMWRELDDADPPKRDYPELAGAVMLTVQSATPPVAAVVGNGLLSAALGSKARMLSLGAAVLVVAGAYTMFMPKGSESEPDVPEAVVETESSAITADPVNDPPAAVPEKPRALERVTLTREEADQPVAVQKELGVNGIVIMENTKAPVSGVEVELLTRVKDGELALSSNFTTSMDGTFSFPEVEPEVDLHLRLGWPYRLTSEPFSRAFWAGGQQDYFVLEAREQGAVTGYVRDPDGAPVYDAYIVREFPFGNRTNGLTHSDEEGRFGFSHDGGIWRIKAKGILGLDTEPVIFDLSYGEIIEHDFTMPHSAAIRLTITKPDGKPPERIHGVTVEIELPELLDNGEHRTRTTTFNSDWVLRDGGEFIFSILGQGRYWITLGAPGFELETVGPLVIDASLTDQYAALVLEPEAAEEAEPDVMGFASREQGNRVENVAVKTVVKDEFGNALNTNGTFVYALDDWGVLHKFPRNLAPGVYWLVAVKEGYGADIQYVEVNAETSELNFTLAEGGTIYGSMRVTENMDVLVYPVEIWEMLGEPVGSLDIDRNVRELGEVLAQGAEADESRAFVLPPLPDGWYVVLSHDAASEPVEVRTGHETGPVFVGSEAADGAE